jgi:predicted Zn-dependent protease with MMP-like domain
LKGKKEMNKRDIVTVATVVGEFVGKYLDQDDHSIMLEDPRMIVNTPEGMGFARGICQTGEENPNGVTLFKTNILFITETNDAVQSSYRQFTSGIIT